MVKSLTKLSDNHYEGLDTRFRNGFYNTKCDALNHELANQFSAYPDISSFCSRLVGNLKNYDHLPHLVNFHKYSCKYLNIWVYENISPVLGKLQLANLSSIKTKIIDIWNDYNLKNICEPEFFSYMNNSNYDIMKKLYDYAVNYYILQQYYDKNKRSCTEEQIKYIEDNLRLYETTKNECKFDTQKLHCIALKNYHDVYKEQDLSKYFCNGKISVEKIEKEVQESIDKSESLLKSKGSPQHSHDMDVQVSALSNSHISDADDTPPFSVSHRNMLIVFPFLGILFTFFVLYKFTPIGSRLHALLLNKKIIEGKMNKSSPQELLENIFDPDEIIAHGDHRSVGYHPMNNI
ncbi:PIR Superfamily Protein [Plasmodium ovale wallikeri]|uniref:PIR Superfamily Protein n=1 Tax=Plasmodium ovale wallikeri TaxID=864142 RepID=A0A1A9AGB6_PLAOA|nr:PIR Superfamily Protein [Plasmodium ovale wallikeri]SBT56303.1 PIR Superfamily Protein [Plasmodium ovale wallikeri]